MDKDLDEELYNEYLKGNKEAFEKLYIKYKNKILYFVFNIVKDYQKSEDIVQEVFIYVLKNKLKNGYSFKYYIYLVAKSKALSYLKVENRRNELNHEYFADQDLKLEENILDTITLEETKKEVIDAINMLDDKYKNAVYLVKIGGLSYKETAEILNENIQNIKNFVHRGKNKLRKILIKKGFNEMNKVLKILLIGIVLTAAISGITYGASIIYKKFNTNHNVNINPSYKSTISENTINNLWIGTLDLAWKDLEEKIGKSKIEFDENIEIANELNESKFTKEMLDNNDYEINVERTHTNGYKIETSLNKELNFLETFDNFKDYNFTFGDGKEPIRYFGINNGSPESMNKNIEILFYNKNDFGIKLKTKEGDEIILYRTDDNKDFDEYYNDIKEKSSLYIGTREFREDDELRIPYINLEGMIFYDELYGKEIKESKGLIMYDVIQNVNFSLNERGCNLSSKSTMITEYLGIGNDTKYCYFQDKFIVFMKEEDAQIPYFALKVDNDDILVKKTEEDEYAVQLTDYTMMENSDRYKVSPGEYKFFEDENFEYYYPNQKTKYVNISYKDRETGDYIHMTAEEGLKQGKITIELLDEYGVEYIKKEK